MTKRSVSQTSTGNKKQKTADEVSDAVFRPAGRQTRSQAQVNKLSKNSDSTATSKASIPKSRPQPKAKPARTSRAQLPAQSQTQQPHKNHAKTRQGSPLNDKESSTFMATIMGNGRAPSPQVAENIGAKKGQGAKGEEKSEEEKNEAEFLDQFPQDSGKNRLKDVLSRDLVEHEDSQNEAESDDGVENAGDGDGGDGDGGDRDGDDHMVVEDITRLVKNRRRRPAEKKAPKVLLSEFENTDLAQLAKHCARMATCVVDMFPSDSFFAWDLFSAQVNKMEEAGMGNDMGASLSAISEDQMERDKLIKYMNYGPSAVRYGIGIQVRIRAADVTWLLKDRKYHHSKVDLENRTFGRMPFKSPLIPLVLRGYFVEGKPEPDKILIDFLEEQQRIPIPLIAMITALIGHCLREYLAGQKTENNFTLKNLGKHYRAILDTLRLLNQNSPEYCEDLQIGLFQKMMTASTDSLPPQTYDYAFLEKLTGKKRNGLGIDSDDSDDDENECDPDVNHSGEDKHEVEDLGENINVPVVASVDEIGVMMAAADGDLEDIQAD